MTLFPVKLAVSHDSRSVRLWIGWFMIAVQLILPSTYYLSNRDPLDERFAWRMFSSINHAHKDADLYACRQRPPEGKRCKTKVPLETVFRDLDRSLMLMGHDDLLRAAGRRTCELGFAVTRIDYRCDTIEGKHFRKTVRSVCDVSPVNVTLS
jgi:hypothetical protein